MTLFLKNCVFFALGFCIILSIGIILPNISKNRSIDYSIIAKHKLLKNTKKPKIILTGGSNVLFGYDSKSLSENLNKPVINHAIHAGYGLKYILDDILPYIKANDLVVLSPEYSHFLDDKYLGSEPILFSLTANPKNIKLLSLPQLAHIAPYVPKFSFDKAKSFIASSLFNKYQIKKKNNVYGEFSINSYGDNYVHLTLKNKEFDSYKYKDNINKKAIIYLTKINEKIEKKGANLMITFPSLNETSFKLNEDIINKIEISLKKESLNIIGNPEDFVFSDDLFFDSPYHLNHKGIKLRTNKLKIILNKAKLE